MFFSQLRIRPLAAAILTFAAPVVSTALAQTTATTDPVGFITLNVAGTGGASGSALSFKGLGLTRPVEYQGSAETVSANTLVDNEATWTDSQFNGANGAFYVEITSGPGAGTTYDISGTTAANKTITLGQNLAQGVANGVTFKVRKHWTIGSVFGPANESGLGGGDSTSADQIRIYNGSTYDTYYYSTGGLVGAGWRKAGSNPANQNQVTTVIYPDDGILVTRQQSAAVNVVLMGAVKMGQSSYPLFNGLNIIANPYAAPMTLGTSNLYTGNAQTGLAAGDATSADEVRIYNGSTYDTYYYSSGGLVGAGWRKAGDNPANTDRASVQIPVGASIVVSRKAPGNFDWVAPQHPTQL